MFYCPQCRMQVVNMDAHRRLYHREAPRSYGTDSTDEFDTLAEATVDEDGITTIKVVVLDKR